MKNKIFSFQVICFLLILTLSSSQKTVKKVINLQQNELYTLDLEELYPFPASSFTFSPNIPSTSITPPYQQFDANSSEGNQYQLLASFDGANQIKYCLGVQQVASGNQNQNDSQNYNYIIVYYILQIDSVTGVLKRQILQQKQIWSDSPSIIGIYASFYNQSSGFITYVFSETQSGLIQFQYTSDQQLQFKTVIYPYLHMFSARQYINANQESSIYLINFSITKPVLKYVLTKYDPINNILFQVDQLDWFGSFPIFSSSDLFITQFTQDVYLFLFLISVDYGLEKLQTQSIPLYNIPYSQQSSKFSFQFQNGMAFYTSRNEETNQTYFAKFNYKKVQNQGQLKLIDDTKTLPFLINEDPKFIDQNLIIVIQNSVLNIINIEQQKTIFQQVLQNSQLSSNLADQVDNQFLLYQIKDSKNILTPIKVQKPTLLLNTQKSDTYTLNIVPTQPEYGVSVQLSVNISADLVPTFSNASILLWKFFGTIQNSIQYLPIEQYVSGLSLNSSVKYSGDLLNQVEIKRLFNQDITFPTIQNFNFGKVYQTEGQFSSIIASLQIEGYYIISATLSTSASYYYECKEVLNQQIQLIDNYGTFITQESMASQQKTILIPFLFEKRLYLFSLQGIQCSDSITTIASDPASNAVFVLCSSKVQYIQYSSPKSTDNLTLQITSQQILDNDYSSFTSMICLNGNLFVYSSAQIASYSYLQNTYGANVLAIPQLDPSKTQSIILFNQSFIVAVYENPVSRIAQYSYGNFQNTAPVYLRKLYIDVNHPINPLLNLFVYRNGREYLFLGSTTQNEYVIYRMNEQYYSQNQLYATTNIYADNNTLPVIANSEICQISRDKILSCQTILSQASISYSLDITDTQFYQNLTFNTPITLQTGSQSQTYNLEIVRNASNKYGVLNSQSQSIQQFRTYLQDNFSAGSVYKMNDSNLFNSCLFGWETLYPQIDITNRIVVNQIQKNSQQVTSYIMYNLKVAIGQGFIIFGNNLQTYSDANISLECRVFDDQATQSIANTNQLSITAYVLCPQKAINLNLQFTLSPNDQSYLSLTVQEKQTNNLDPAGTLSLINRVISYNNQIWLYDTVNSQSYQLVQNTTVTQLQVVANLDLSPTISRNVINNNQVYLEFYQNGVINFVNSMDSKNIYKSSSSIQEILNQQGFFIKSNDYIASIQQIKDNLFRIQIQNYFIFEIVFNFDNNQNLIAKTAFLFYYQEAIQQQVFSAINGDQTVILGLDSKNNMQVLLYNYSNQKNNQLLFQSVLQLNNTVNTQLTYAQLETKNKLTLSFSNGDNEETTISEDISIVFDQDRFYFQGGAFNIYPLNNTSSGSFSFNIISNIDPPTPPIPPTSQSITSSYLLIFSTFNLIVGCVALVVLI